MRIDRRNSPSGERLSWRPSCFLSEHHYRAFSPQAERFEDCRPGGTPSVVVAGPLTDRNEPDGVLCLISSGQIPDVVARTKWDYCG